MRIRYPVSPSVRFDLLKVGDVFSYCGETYCKIRPIDLDKNAICFSTGLTAYFPETSLVLPWLNAILVLEPGGDLCV